MKSKAENIVQFYPNRITVSRAKTPAIQSITKNYVRKKLYRWGQERADAYGLDYSPPNKEDRGLWEDWKTQFLGIYSPPPKTSVNLSKHSKKNIRDSIMAMHQLSLPRTVKGANGKFIYNFRQSFITLTLPSEQKHPDTQIKKCLDHFLTNIRRTFKMQNYVWKAELQRNANIHFHISTDTYIPFQAIRYYWLLSIKPLGYVDAYAAKWSNLTLAEYANKRGISLDDARKPYADGVRSRWQSPNCVDVRSVTTAQSASFYLSKYFAKSDDEKIDPDRIAAFGKVWARSQSLSRLAFKNKFSLSEIQDLVKLN